LPRWITWCGKPGTTSLAVLDIAIYKTLDSSYFYHEKIKKKKEKKNSVNLGCPHFFFFPFFPLVFSWLFSIILIRGEKIR